MASIYMTSAAPANDGVFARFFQRLMNAATAYGAAQSRADQVALLNAKTDEELARIGLRREDIARYVFRDILYI